MIGFTCHMGKIFQSHLQRKISLIDNEHNNNKHPFDLKMLRHLYYPCILSVSPSFLPSSNFPLGKLFNSHNRQCQQKKYPSIFSHEIEEAIVYICTPCTSCLMI